jgi:hypothetical protein
MIYKHFFTRFLWGGLPQTTGIHGFVPIPEIAVFNSLYANTQAASKSAAILFPQHIQRFIIIYTVQAGRDSYSLKQQSQLVYKGRLYMQL